MKTTATEVVLRQREYEHHLANALRRIEEHLVAPLMRQYFAILTIEVLADAAHEEIRQMARAARAASDAAFDRLLWDNAQRYVKALYP